MDLDNIKKTWQETDIKTVIDDSKIQKMLDNKGRGAFENLLKYERLFLKLLIFCLFLEVLFFYIHLWLGIAYGVLLVYGFIWQRYKIQFLTKIDLSSMSILAVSKFITQYKKYIFYEIIVGIICGIVFFIFYTYFILPQIFPRLFVEGSSLSLILSLVSIGVTFVFLFFIYKNMYFNNIKKMQASIREIEEFEKTNKD